MKWARGSLETRSLLDWNQMAMFSFSNLYEMCWITNQFRTGPIEELPPVRRG